MKVLDTKNAVMHGVPGVYLQQTHLTYFHIFRQYCPGKDRIPLVDTHISTFMHQVNEEKASNVCQNPVEHPQNFFPQKDERLRHQKHGHAWTLPPTPFFHLSPYFHAIFPWKKVQSSC
jgi:hypothetical protein